MKLTPAKSQDAPALALILSDWIDETAWMPKIHTPQEDLRFLHHLIETQDVTVLRNATQPMGFMAQAGDTIHALYLRPPARGMGYGAQFLDQAKSKAAQLDLWTFQANTGARAFYAREGFVEVEETDGAGNDEKQPDVRLRWEQRA